MSQPSTAIAVGGQLTRGSPDADTERMKMDPATGIVRILGERCLFVRRRRAHQRDPGRLLPHPQGYLSTALQLMAS